jgi:hypothetical protein
MPVSQIRYSEWSCLDDAGVLHVDVQLPDCATLLSFLRGCGLAFNCTELESGGEEVTFRAGTTVHQVHAALVQFDGPSRQVSYRLVKNRPTHFSDLIYLKFSSAPQLAAWLQSWDVAS